MRILIAVVFMATLGGQTVMAENFQEVFSHHSLSS